MMKYYHLNLCCKKGIFFKILTSGKTKKTAFKPLFFQNTFQKKPSEEGLKII